MTVKLYYKDGIDVEYENVTHCDFDSNMDAIIIESGTRKTFVPIDRLMVWVLDDGEI